MKKVFLEISKNSQENIYASVSFFNKVAGLRPAILLILLKKRLWHRCFPVNFAKFLKTPFLKRTPPVAASIKTIYLIDDDNDESVLWYG